MSWESDPANLRVLYADPTALRGRQRHYAEPQQGATFVDWVLGLVDLGRARRILDVGAGVGRFTLPLARTCPGYVVATDLFVGMVGALRESLVAKGMRAGVVVANITSLPFPRSAFDLVFANHMLYHVHDIDRAVRELARMTSPYGTCVATTNADDVPIPVIDLHYAALERLGEPRQRREASSFSLRNGGRGYVTGSKR